MFVGMVSLPGNRLATATSSGVVSVWDADSWRCVASYRGPQRTSALAALPDGRLAIGSRKPSGMNITIWDPSGGAFCWSAQDDPFATTSDAKVQYLTRRVVFALAACADGRLACSCCGHPSRFDVQAAPLPASLQSASLEATGHLSCNCVVGGCVPLAITLMCSSRARCRSSPPFRIQGDSCAE